MPAFSPSPQSPRRVQKAVEPSARAPSRRSSATRPARISSFNYPPAAAPVAAGCSPLIFRTLSPTASTEQCLPLRNIHELSNSVLIPTELSFTAFPVPLSTFRLTPRHSQSAFAVLSHPQLRSTRLYGLYCPVPALPRLSPSLHDGHSATSLSLPAQPYPLLPFSFS